MKIIQAISAHAGLSRFASFVYTSRATGEVARYTVQLGFSYENAVRKSLEELRSIDSQSEAKQQLEASLQDTLEGTQSNYTKQNNYIPFIDDNGNPVQGLKVNVNDGSLKIFALIVSKVQITPPVVEEKPKKSAALTIEKHKLRKNLPVGRFREFDLDNVLVARLNGDTLILE
jgi:hypothetical protein